MRSEASTGSKAAIRSNASNPSQTFFRYTDSQGRVVIVDSLDKLPSGARTQAERLELEVAPSQPWSLPDQHSTAEAKSSPVHLGSLALGAALTAACIGTALLLRRSGSLLLAKVLGGAALVALLGGLYLGLLRRTTGQGGELLASPVELIRDAKKTVEQANEHRRRQQEELDAIQRDAK